MLYDSRHHPYHLAREQQMTVHVYLGVDLPALAVVNDEGDKQPLHHVGDQKGERRDSRSIGLGVRPRDLKLSCRRVDEVIPTTGEFFISLLSSKPGSFLDGVIVTTKGTTFAILSPAYEFDSKNHR